MKKIIILFLTMLCFIQYRAQQDPQYSQYQFNQLAVNPAYSGARDAIAVVMDLRKQWVSFPGAPSTLAFTIHTPISNNKIGLGLNATSDKIGARSATGIYGNFAYIAKLNNQYKLSFGLRAGYLTYSYNTNEITYKDANEIIDLSKNLSALDIDAGLYLKGNSFFLGFSTTHLNQANIYSTSYTVTSSSFSNATYKLRPHIFITMGKAFTLGEDVTFTPSFMIKTVSTLTTTDLNLNFLLKKRVWVGLFVRQGYGAGLLLQVYATDKFRIGYTYDRGSSSKKILGPSHEFMLGFDFGNYKAKTVSPRFL